MEVYSYSISDFRSSLSRIWQGSTDKYGTVMKGTCRKCFLNDGYLSWGWRLLDVMNLEEPHFPFWKKSFLPGAKPDILIGYQTIFVFDLTRFSFEILPNSTFIIFHDFKERTYNMIYSLYNYYISLIYNMNIIYRRRNIKLKYYTMHCN